MNFQTLMQIGPAKVNELFARLSETSEGAVKTREKLFAELKAELELHTSIEKQHLFPILRRNAETKKLLAEAIKDNKELQAKLAELEALPKKDETFPARLKELQKTFRQHARDEKRELMPAVQRALNEEQLQGVAEKIEASVVEADQARQDEVEERRTKARQKREQAERQETAERTQTTAIEHARREKTEREREEAQRQRGLVERQMEQEAAIKRAQDEAERHAHDAAETVAQTATGVQASVLRAVENAASGAQRVGVEFRSAADARTDTMRAKMPDLQAVASLPSVAVGIMTEIRSAWMEWMGQTTRAGTQMPQERLWQSAKQQQRFAADVMQGWMEHNERIMRITMRMAQEGFRPFVNRSATGSDQSRTGR
jgi:hypothetical protein